MIAPTTAQAPDPMFRSVDWSVLKPNLAIIEGPTHVSCQSLILRVRQLTKSSQATIWKASGDEQKHHVESNVDEAFK
jgi:hypothetical protein